MAIKEKKFEDYEGCIKYRTLKNSERFGFMQALGIDYKMMKQIQENGDFQMDVSSIGGMLNETAKYIEGVDLKKGEQRFTSWEQLDEEPDCLQVQIDCMTAVLGMGKN